MKDLRHPNIVQFMGATWKPRGIVMQYMHRGSLFRLLHRSSKASCLPSPSPSPSPVPVSHDLGCNCLSFHLRPAMRRFVPLLIAMGTSRRASGCICTGGCAWRWTWRLVSDPPPPHGNLHESCLSLLSPEPQSPVSSQWAQSTPALDDVLPFGQACGTCTPASRSLCTAT